jgi:hypothetical protein
VRLGELTVLYGQRIALVACGADLERCPLEAQLELAELAERLALELGGAGERVACLLEPAGLSEGGRHRRQDQAARLRHPVAQPRERSLPRLQSVVELSERHSRLDGRAHGGREHVRVWVGVVAEQRDRPVGIRQGVLRAAGEQPDIGARGVNHRQRESVRRGDGLSRLDGPLDLALRRIQIAHLLEITGEIVAGGRLLPSVARLDRERQQLIEPLAPVAHAQVAEHHAGGAPGEYPEVGVPSLVGSLDRGLGMRVRRPLHQGVDR